MVQGSHRCNAKHQIAGAVSFEMTDTAMMCALAANVQQLQHFVVRSAAPNEHCILLANVDFSASATKTIADQRDSRSGARAASILFWGGLFQQPNTAQGFQLA